MSLSLSLSIYSAPCPSTPPQYSREPGCSNSTTCALGRLFSRLTICPNKRPDNSFRMARVHQQSATLPHMCPLCVCFVSALGAYTQTGHEHFVFKANNVCVRECTSARIVRLTIKMRDERACRARFAAVCSCVCVWPLSLPSQRVATKRERLRDGEWWCRDKAGVRMCGECALCSERTTNASQSARPASPITTHKTTVVHVWFLYTCMRIMTNIPMLGWWMWGVAMCSQCFVGHLRTLQ